jgi:alpha-acetolactate decarboxylase
MKRMKFCFVFGLLLFVFQQQLFAQIKEKSKSDKIYQYSLFTALANKIYEGNLTVAEVKEKGDLGLGTFNGLNGEMIVLDGTVYQWLANGTVQLPEDSELVPFTVVTHFDEDLKFEMPSVTNYNELKTFIESKLPSNNFGYAFKIKADFKTFKCGSADKQEKPYSKTLSDAIVDRPTFNMENISGTMVGFWYPEYTGKINVAGFHLHFISDDKKQAGHVMEFQASNIQIFVDLCDGYEIDLPRTKDFEISDFDLTQEYNNKSTVKQTGNQETWNGFVLLDSTLNGVPFKVVFPKTPNKNRNWIWRARFWGHEPQTDIALLEQGFHLVYIEVGGLFGCEKAIKIWDDFYDFVTQKYQLNKKTVLEGMSRGGLIIFNWGNRNADKVACIYGDAPVCDFKSWPGGFGVGPGSKEDWKICLEQYGFTEQIVLKYNGNPVDHMENIASHKVPVIIVVGDADEVVPVSENAALLEKRLNMLGWGLEIIHKPGIGHHPHSLKDPQPIVDFILKNTEN